MAKQHRRAHTFYLAITLYPGPEIMYMTCGNKSKFTEMSSLDIAAKATCATCQRKRSKVDRRGRLDEARARLVDLRRK